MLLYVAPAKMSHDEVTRLCRLIRHQVVGTVRSATLPTMDASGVQISPISCLFYLSVRAGDIMNGYDYFSVLLDTTFHE